MTKSDFLYIQNKSPNTTSLANGLFSFNRYEVLKTTEKTEYLSELSAIEIFKPEFGQTSYYIWGDIYFRNEYNRANSTLLNTIDIANLHFTFGDDFIREIKGSFVILAIGADTSIKLFTDQLHSRSVYYYSRNDLILIASDLSIVVKCLHEKRHTVSANHRWLIEYLLYGYALDNSTLIENVFESKPGQIINLSNGNVKLGSYFNVLDNLDYSGPKMTSHEGEEYLKHVFNKNIALYDRGTNTTAVALTGGYDSRSIIASLGNNYKAYDYYSYGRQASWDIGIPQQIADKLDLKYSPFIFSKEFDEQFIENGKQAVLLSDGVGRLSFANYVYVYSSFLPGKNNILTGLFGSELIKRFTGANLAISQNMLDILTTGQIGEMLSKQMTMITQQYFFSGEFIEEYKDQIEVNLKANNLICNDLPQNQKVFLHFLSIGTRHYFQKELKIQSPWVNNLHPFYDIDFIEALLQTPFPNLYNWELKKNLIKNLKTHKLYGALIDQKPELSGFMSTHGFRPKYLRKKLYAPMIALDFYRYKKQISSASSATYNDLISKSIAHVIEEMKIGHDSIFYNMINHADRRNPKFLQMISTLFWLQQHGIDV